jgi:hypothetical protein
VGELIFDRDHALVGILAAGKRAFRSATDGLWLNVILKKRIAHGSLIMPPFDVNLICR